MEITLNYPSVWPPVGHTIVNSAVLYREGGGVGFSAEDISIGTATFIDGTNGIRLTLDEPLSVGTTPTSAYLAVPVRRENISSASYLKASITNFGVIPSRPSNPLKTGNSMMAVNLTLSGDDIWLSGAASPSLASYSDDPVGILQLWLSKAPTTSLTLTRIGIQVFNINAPMLGVTFLLAKDVNGDGAFNTGEGDSLYEQMRVLNAQSIGTSFDLEEVFQPESSIAGSPKFLLMAKAGTGMGGWFKAQWNSSLFLPSGKVKLEPSANAIWEGQAADPLLKEVEVTGKNLAPSRIEPNTLYPLMALTMKTASGTSAWSYLSVSLHANSSFPSMNAFLFEYWTGFFILAHKASGRHTLKSW